MLTLAEFLSPWDIIQVMAQDSVPVQHLAVPPPYSNPLAVHGKQWELTELHLGRGKGSFLPLLSVPYLPSSLKHFPFKL